MLVPVPVRVDTTRCQSTSHVRYHGLTIRVIGDSDDETPRASSPKKRTRKRTVEITPPPELSAAKKAELQEATR